MRAPSPLVITIDNHETPGKPDKPIAKPERKKHEMKPTRSSLSRFRDCLSAILMACMVFASSYGADEAKPKDGGKKHSNRLAKESSPYLLQHAHNPVDWHPWGPEAFAKAKKEGKLVFLSIGYSSCHWCHVMERESFENEDVAKLLDQGFVCIKVDREERPDIDHIYMTALQVQGQGGGWPLSMFLTADAKPIVGGTYWPREDREVEGEKVRGFKSIVKLVHDVHKNNPKEIDNLSEKLATGTIDALAGAARGVALAELNRDLVTPCLDALKERHDPVHGGFGSKARNFKGTKFPTPPHLELLFQEATRTKSDELMTIVTRTLDRMAHGGIYDQLGGGFHRYSTERTWTIPHFEKMLYDNAQLVEVYSRAFQQTKNPVYRRVVRETLDFITREMTAPEGGFYSALDADSEGEEGKFYVWTAKEIDEALNDDTGSKLIKSVYGADGAANFESKYIILTLPKPLAEVARDMKISEADLEARLMPLKKKLLEVRGKRPRPFLDTKVLTAWNGQMIAGYALAGQVFDEPKYKQAAARAADFILTKLRNQDGRLLRTYSAAPDQKAEAKLNAYLDDYAFLVHGLLALHDATGDRKWLDEAKTLTDTMVRFHTDKDAGGFFYTSSDHEKLFARAKDQYDGAQPSGNSVAVRNLVRLWIKTKDDNYHTLAKKHLKAFVIQLKLEPTSMSTLASALGLYLDAEEKGKKP